MTYARLRETTESKESVALSRDLKRRGWSFIGPTTAYAFMQAMGLVDDHIDGCVIRERTQARRRSFCRPV
jgi:DNA-3-methyladenine glycosylase I